MTTYETVMVVLTCLTLVVSLMMLVIKLLLIIIDKSEIQGQPLTGSSFSQLHYSLYKTESQYTSVLRITTY